jgi:serine/threonine-protein kinase HipA
MSLDVHLHGERIGTLFPAGENDYRFAYDPKLVDRIGSGKSLLSNALPVRAEPFSFEATAAYVEGLLPDARRRRRVAKELGIDPADGYGLLREVGRDCPGAVVFLPEGTEIDENPDPESLDWLSEEELAEVVKPPPPRLFTDECPGRMRFALAGTRHKLALVRDEENDRWAWPQAGAPSTHVVKPETGEYPEYVANEMFCMTVCRQAGLPVAKATVERIAGRSCLVSERFDREGEGLGAKRIHQESFCQALGITPFAEPETEEGEAPGFAEAAGLLHAVSRPDDVITLLNVAFCNYMLGNGDAHGENFPLVDRDGRWRMGPIHDVGSLAVYDEPLYVGMTIAEDADETVYLLELAEICEECEFDFEILRGLASVAAARVGKAIETVANRSRKEGWHEPVVDRIVELAAERSFGLGAEVEY